MNWNSLKLRIRAVFWKTRAEDDLEDELQFHLSMEAQKHQASGLVEAEAARKAKISFGGLDQVKEACRDTRGISLIESTLQDLRYALKRVLREPWFAITVVATIGLGLGLNTALFTVFNAAVLRPLPVRDPDSLYQFAWYTRSSSGFISPENVRQVFNHSEAFLDILTYETVFSKSAGQFCRGKVKSSYLGKVESSY